MEPSPKSKSSPLFYIFKGNNLSYFFIELKHRKRQFSFQNRKFKCPFKQCNKYYSHKNKMLAHLRTHVTTLFSYSSFSMELSLSLVLFVKSASTKKEI